MTSLTPDALPYAYHSSVWITARLQLGRPLTCERVPARVTCACTYHKASMQGVDRALRARCYMHMHMCMQQHGACAGIMCGALPARMDAIAAGSSPGGYSVATALPGWAGCRVQRVQDDTRSSTIRGRTATTAMVRRENIAAELKHGSSK